jgi:biotin carboxyl carrier protein
LKAPVSGVIKELKTKAGDKVDKGQLLAEIS